MMTLPPRAAAGRDRRTSCRCRCRPRRRAAVRSAIACATACGHRELLRAEAEAGQRAGSVPPSRKMRVERGIASAGLLASTASHERGLQAPPGRARLLAAGCLAVLRAWLRRCASPSGSAVTQPRAARLARRLVVELMTRSSYASSVSADAPREIGQGVEPELLQRLCRLDRGLVLPRASRSAAWYGRVIVDLLLVDAEFALGAVHALLRLGRPNSMISMLFTCRHIV